MAPQVLLKNNSISSVSAEQDGLIMLVPTEHFVNFSVLFYWLALAGFRAVLQVSLPASNWLKGFAEGMQMAVKTCQLPIRCQSLFVRHQLLSIDHLYSTCDKK